jgi:SAM-dependent methyltransferase
MNWSFVVSRAILVFREGGPRALAKAAAASLRRGTGEADAFDRKWGVDTAKTVPAWALVGAAPNRFHARRYQASPAELIEASLASIVDEPSLFAFVDLGAGKGRALIVAARMGFAKVTGVELDGTLCAIARRNLAKLGLDRVEVAHMDAAEYAFPRRDLAVFLYHPFGAEVLGPVMERLKASFEGVHDKRVYIVYLNPAHRALIDADSRFVALEPRADLPDVARWRMRAPPSPGVALE